MERHQVAKVLDKVGVVGDEAVVDTLQMILEQEKANITTSADNIVSALKGDSKLSQHDPAVLALAIKQNRFHSAPARQARLDTARLENVKEVAWPLGPLLRVPLDQAVAHRADVVLRATDASPPFLVDKQSGAVARAKELSVPQQPVGASLVSTLKSAGDKAESKGAAAKSRRGAASEAFTEE